MFSNLCLVMGSVVLASTNSAPTAGELAEAAGTTDSVRATFIQEDDGAPGKTLPEEAPKVRRHAPWDRPERAVPAHLQAAELPTYYVSQGRAIEMRIDASRILVKIAGAVGPAAQAEAAGIARGVGVPVIGATDPGVDGYALVHPAVELAGEGGVNAAIELLLTDPRIEYAAPVYHHPEIEGGMIAMLPEINVRASQANADRALEVVDKASKGARVINPRLANLPGAVQIRPEERNGFSTLRLANQMAVDPELAWACPTLLMTMEMHVYTPNDQFFGTSSMWGWFNDGAGSAVADMDTDADEAWELTRGRSSIRVVALDLGSDQDHPDINQLTGRTFTDGSANGFGTGEPATPCDNHGTPVAGIIAGRINNSIGGAGVCPNCRVISAKVGTTPAPAPGDPCGGAWGGNGAPGNTLDVRLTNAILWGENQGARISNHSYGTGESDLLTDALNDTAINGMLHFASAGNGGADNIGDPTLGYPARLANVISVAAIDSDGGRSSFSNYGNGLDFSAPGTNVRGTDRAGSAGYTGTDYTTFSGTSAASPFAAGCAALIWSAYPDYTDSGILNLMRFYSTDLGVAGPDTGYGWGFPNVNAAIRAVFPYNNWCVEATTITGMTYNPATYSTANASEVPEERDESCELNNAGVSHSVWYRFVAPCDGELNINTNGSNYDTVLSVFQGSCTSSIQIACDDDSGEGTRSQLTGVDVTAGLTYYIKVSAYGPNSSGGLLDFNFEFDPIAHNNDQCNNAFDIPFHQLTLNSCTVGATSSDCEGNEPCEAGNVGTGHSVWYQFHTPSIGRFNLDTFGSNYDTVLSVWRGSCGAALNINGQVLCAIVPTNVACNDDAAGGFQSRISNLVVDGNTTYRFKIASYGNSPGGDMTFHFQFVPCPADFNLSGVLSVQDIFDFLNAYFSNDPRANFNHFGGITVQDIFDFLAAYFSGCN